MKFALFTSALALSATVATASMEPGRSAVKSRHGSMMRRLKDSVLGGADAYNATAQEQALAKRATPGRATFYDVGEGACGSYNTANQNVVALNIEQYGDQNSVSKYCFKNIQITYQGKTETAQIVDCCPSCPYGALDMSKGLFGSLADFDLGVFQMSWSFLDGSDDDDDESSSSSSSTHRSKSHYTPASTAKKVKATTSTSTHTSTSTTTSTPSSTSSSSSTSSASTAILVLATPTDAAAASSSVSAADAAAATATSTGESTTPDNLNGLVQIIKGFQGIAQIAHQ